MSRKDDDEALFRGAMAAAGVRPVAPGAGRVPVVPLRTKPLPSARRTVARPPLLGDAAREDEAGGAPPRLLSLERRGEEVTARADGVDKRTLRKLATGELPIAARLDLHGEIGRIAEEKTVRFLAAAVDAGHQVVAVVHGRGLHSGREGPVLKDLVLAALSEGRARDHVLALASAPLRLGGPGVTLVLLRRRR